MPPVRTAASRASKACDGCRKGKQRCYQTASASCLRCTTLRVQCSLNSNTSLPNRAPAPPAASVSSSAFVSEHVTRPHDCLAVEARVSALEQTIDRLSKAIGLAPEPVSGDVVQDASSIRAKQTNSPIHLPEPPLQVIHDAASVTQSEVQDSPVLETIIDKGLLVPHEVSQLLVLFRTCYGRWIALREVDQPVSDSEIIKSPLLLCACCLIAIRHSSVEWASLTAPLLFSEAKRLLGEALLQASKSLSFFQAVLILSLWSTTIAQKPMSLDSWLISGYAIQQGSASDVTRASVDVSVLQRRPPANTGTLLLWNRLCLAHLHACVSMRRSTVLITKMTINSITKSLPAEELTNFETRMLAELSLYWILYDSTVASTIDLLQAQSTLRDWKQEWSSLFIQPRSQFLLLSFHFAQLLLFEQALNTRSAAARESMLVEMIRLSSTILQVARDTTDDKTKHLTDHIYHMIAFAAVTLCRLLCKYSGLARCGLNSGDLDVMVVETVQWLRSLGSPLHIGHIMGNIIDTVHRKLRPEARVPVQDNGDMEHNFLQHSHMFPDLLGFAPGISMGSLDIDWDAMVPDWQSYASEDTGASAELGR